MARDLARSYDIITTAWLQTSASIGSIFLSSNLELIKVHTMAENTFIRLIFASGQHSVFLPGRGHDSSRHVTSSGDHLVFANFFSI